jgi:hypothetical protein
MSFWKESNIITATHHNNKIWYQKLGGTISHFAKHRSSSTCLQNQKNKHQFISLSLHLPTYLQAKKEKNTIEKQTDQAASASFSMRLCCVDLWKNTVDKKLNTKRCVMLIMLTLKAQDCGSTKEEK